MGSLYFTIPTTKKTGGQMTKKEISNWLKNKEQIKISSENEFLDSKPMSRPMLSLWETED